ncbi:type II toxin-antitoxin system Phd/YefM family antitoxin [Breznakiellaceae bacterium SP9]
MPTIRPVSDLQNNLAEISQVVHESSEPVFLTQDGYGDMVIMSMPAWEEKQFESEIYNKLLEAETEARFSSTRLSHEEVFSGLRLRIKDHLSNV